MVQFLNTDNGRILHAGGAWVEKYDRASNMVRLDGPDEPKPVDVPAEPTVEHPACFGEPEGIVDSVCDACPMLIDCMEAVEAAENLTEASVPEEPKHKHGRK
ncbi:MAG: hypothetical protein V2A79_01055 [Planctomycetota bacterium]